MASADWSVRVPLIGSAAGSNAPLVNPFNFVGGFAPKLAYYYYRYQAQGVVAATFRLPARAVMAAGCVWACWALLSTLLLTLRFLFTPGDDRAHWSWAYWLKWLLIGMPILGLDFLQVLYAAAFRHRIWPETEWWRAPDALAPSFQTALLYAPHHTTGISAVLLGLLFVSQFQLQSHTAEPAVRTKNQVLLASTLSSICFAAVAGTSTYVALFLVLGCVLFGFDRLLRRDWSSLALLGISGLFATCMTLPFLQVMLARDLPEAGGRALPVAFELREFTATYYWLSGCILQVMHRTFGRAVTLPLTLPAYALSLLAEGGFLLLIVLYRMHADARADKLSEQKRMQWMVAWSCIGPALLLTSKAAIGSNDLGFHAALMLRFVALLWAAPILRDLAHSERRQRYPRWLVMSAVPFIGLGITLQAWQVVEQRTIPYLSEHGLSVLPGPLPSPPELGQRYQQVYELWQTIDAREPATAVVATNPDSTQRSLATIYANRQLLAAEPGCMTAFGGSPVACRSAMPQIRALYAAHVTDRPSSADILNDACRQFAVTAVVVSSDDPVWTEPSSWVWQLSPAFRNASERLFECPHVRTGSSPHV